MQIDQVWSELIARGVDITYKEKAPECRSKLSQTLKGSN